MEDEQRERTLKWLNPVDVEQTATSISKKWVQGTSEWILQTPAYGRWDMSRTKEEPLQLLWLRGTLGCGKTFLAHYISQTLLATKHNVLRYYFSAKQEMGIRRSHISFVRTILYQAIVNTNFDTSSTLEALHHLREISGKAEAQSPMKLWSEIFRLVQDHAQSPIYLIVDALDEANQDERDDILQALAKLISLTPLVRIVITSRPEEDILTWFERISRSDSLAKAVSQIRIPHEATIRDIEIYIQSRVQQSAKLRHPSVMEDVKSTILNRAEGMFLYVRLMIDELETETSVGGIRRHLQEFPANLNEYYDKVFSRIESNSRSAQELARNLLAWVTTSYLPMNVDTLLVALKSQACARRAFQQSPTGVDSNDELELLDPLNEIRSICFPLLEVTEGGIVQVVHCSVAAYILNTGMSARNTHRSTLLLTLPQASLEIAVACVYSLQSSANWPTADHPGTTPDPSSIFLEYSTKYWPEHMSDAPQDALLLLSSLLQTLDAEQPWFLDWIRRRSEIDYRFRKFLDVDEGRIPTHLEIAAYFGITSWAIFLLNCRRNDTSSLIPPSLIAATQGSLNILRLFYQQIGAGESWDAQKNRLLHAAARNGHASVVQFLIEKAGCDIDNVDSFGRSALMQASSRGHTAVVSALLKHGANTSLISRAAQSATEDAAAAGDIRSLKLLFAASESNVTDKCLLLSSANGHDGIVEFLLQHTALRPDCVDENSWTPLHWACRNGHVDVVAALLTRELNVDARDGFERTPLNRAVRTGNVIIVSMLLRAGASPVSCDSSGLSLVHFAAAGGFKVVLELLLGAGVDPNTGSFPRVFPKTTWQHGSDLTPSGPPLHLAAEGGHVATLNHLLSCGAEVDKKGPSGETALHKACLAGQDASVRVLLEANANDEFRGDHEYHFPLVIAVRNRHIGIISLLAPLAWSRVKPRANSSRFDYLSLYKSPILSAMRAAADCDNSQEVLRVLFSYAPSNLPLPEYIGLDVVSNIFRSGRVACAEFIASLGFDLSRSTSMLEQYPTPLGLAIHGQNLAMIQFLINRKVNPFDFQPTPEAKLYDRYTSAPSIELTALDMAALHGNGDIINLLIDRQSQPPDPDDFQSKWDRIVDRAALLPRLKYFADVRKVAQVQTQSSALFHRGWADASPQALKPISSMCAAIASGDLEWIQNAIDEGADVNEIDWEFETPLIKAIKAGSPEIVTPLLDAGADVDSRSIDGVSAVVLANALSSAEIVRLLLLAGSSTQGLTLEKAAVSENLDLIKMLLDAGVDPNLYQKDSVCPSFWSSKPPLHTVVASYNDGFADAAIPILLASGARLFDEACTKEETVLHIAADRARVGLLRMFLEMGVPIDVCDSQGRTALHRALTSKNKDAEAAWQELLRLGASTAQMGEQQISALHTASGSGNYRMVEWLIHADGGRSINNRDAKGQTPLMWAVMGDWAFSPNREFLGGNHRTGFWRQRRQSTNVDTVRVLLESGADITLEDSQERNVLHWAAMMGTANILRLLLSLGADVHASDMNGRTPLHLAIMEGAIECVELLLAAGANPNAIDHAPTGGSSGQLLRRMELAAANRPAQMDPLHLAFQEPDYSRLKKMARLLLDAGANVFGRNFEGETCLHVAAKDGNVAAVEELICANNFDNLYIAVKDNAGRTARDLAEQLGHARIVALLRDAEKGRVPGSRYSGTTIIPFDVKDADFVDRLRFY
jgi:ankyrin repeat protein